MSFLQPLDFSEAQVQKAKLNDILRCNQENDSYDQPPVSFIDKEALVLSRYPAPTFKGKTVDAPKAGTGGAGSDGAIVAYAGITEDRKDSFKPVDLSRQYSRVAAQKTAEVGLSEVYNANSLMRAGVIVDESKLATKATNTLNGSVDPVLSTLKDILHSLESRSLPRLEDVSTRKSKDYHNSSRL